MNAKPLITIFTPTYNRAYILPQLYKSLTEQSFKNFEWIVVDDGSSDGTKALFDKWQKEASFPVIYKKVENGGKHRAINKGVKLANGELFFIVDSDDRLIPETLNFIANEYNSIKDDNRFCGLAGSRGTLQGHRIGGYFPPCPIDCSCIDFRIKYKIKGDMAEVFKTAILRQYPFPEYEGEKFCPEALIWNRIGLKYLMRFFPDITYITEYLPDGLTASIIRLRHQSPMASMLYYSEYTQLPISFTSRLKGAINYWRFRNTPPNRKSNTIDICIMFSCIAFIPGKLMRYNDFWKL